MKKDKETTNEKMKETLNEIANLKVIAKSQNIKIQTESAVCGSNTKYVCK